MNELPSFAYVLKVMENAGLTPTEMINLLPIGRATFYSWKRGQPIGDILRYRLTIARCKVIEQATLAGKLPLSVNVLRSSRRPAIEKALAEARLSR
jgi:hypothetical protein